MTAPVMMGVMLINDHSSDDEDETKNEVHTFVEVMAYSYESYASEYCN